MQVIPQSYIREALADLRLWFFDLLVWIAQFVELPRDVRLYMQGELRTARSSGTTAVNIGGNSASDTNPGEMTIMVLDGIGPEQPLRPDTPRTPRRD